MAFAKICRGFLLAFTVSAAGLAACNGGSGKDRFILATTHTLEDSGLLDSLATQFKADHPEHPMSVVVAGSGEILVMGRRGDADALLTHAPSDEAAFVAEGYGVARIPVMHNTFVIAGPTEDPARAANANTAAEAFRRIGDAAQPFVSRGDDSGTHKKELALWAAVGRKPGSNYIEAGTGMSDALRMASERGAYILTDLATFLMVKHQLRLELLYQGDPALRNEYSVIVVKNARNAAAANAFAQWIVGEPAQKRINAFGRSAFGRSLFVGDAGR
jgi:tungstate transport system substrate-binding protein